MKAKTLTVSFASAALLLTACGDSSTDTTATGTTTEAAATVTTTTAAADTARASESAAPTSTDMVASVTSTLAAAEDIITAESSPELAAILQDVDNCSAQVSDFAAANKGKTIVFDGYVANLIPGDTGTRVLANPGTINPQGMPYGPSFEYTAGDLGIDPTILEVGTSASFTGIVDHFDPQSCQFFLTPGSITPQ